MCGLAYVHQVAEIIEGVRASDQFKGLLLLLLHVGR